MSRSYPFDAIASTVDLDDPREHDNAQRFMVGALTRVIDCLPVIAQSAVVTTQQNAEGTANADKVLAMRVKLWNEIQGRDQSDQPDVLRIRTTICAMHGMDAEAPCDKLEHFLEFWMRSGLSMAELGGAILDAYGVVCPPLGFARNLG